jgi:hypothetical protein
MFLRYATSLIIVALAISARADVPTEATILDSQILWDPICVDSAAVSPDGTMIAYISKGAIWSCSVTAGPPKKLVDLPDTLTALLTLPENREARDKFAYVAANPNYRPLPHLRTQIIGFFGLEWTRSQDGLTYTLQRHSSTPGSFAYDVSTFR